LLTPSESLPAPGQGALGIECLESRTDLAGLLAPLNHADTTRCVAAERAFSLALSGNCNLPLGAYAEINGAHLRLRGFVGSPDGLRIVSGELEGPGADPESLGSALAQQLKAQGAADILAQLQE
jgi:hydroxymethylbilane synthase